MVCLDVNVHNVVCYQDRYVHNMVCLDVDNFLLHIITKLRCLEVGPWNAVYYTEPQQPDMNVNKSWSRLLVYSQVALESAAYLIPI